MNENVENMILVQLREMRAEMAEMRSDLSSLKDQMAEGFEEQTIRSNGIALILTMLAGNVHGLEERVEKLERAHT